MRLRRSDRVFVVGQIYRFSYLWAREHDRGEDSGRKDRPACLLLRSAKSPDLLVMYAITTSRPDSGRVALEVPQIERRAAGLDQKCWVVLDEFNISSASDPVDFASAQPIGAFSSAFVRRLLEMARTTIAERRARAIRRE
jgi:hypothetical protein